MIYYHFEDVKFSLTNRLKLRSWINQVVEKERKQTGDINYIFCSDEYLLNLNRSALNHDYYTDIITFDYCEEEVVNGDLFISIDRVKDNAKQLNFKMIDELHRVMIHGVLHLCGYKDKTKKDEEAMRKMEDKSLSLRQF